MIHIGFLHDPFLSTVMKFNRGSCKLQATSDSYGPELI